jgi:hypothetical protein
LRAAGFRRAILRATGFRRAAVLRPGAFALRALTLRFTAVLAMSSLPLCSESIRTTESFADVRDFVDGSKRSRVVFSRLCFCDVAQKPQK